MSTIQSRNYSYQLGMMPRPRKTYWVTFSNGVTGNIDSVTATRRGTLFAAGSPFIGRPISKCAFSLRISAGTPTGNYTFTLRDGSDVLVATLATFDIASTLVITTYKWVYAEFPVQIIPSGGRLQVEYTGGDASNRLSVPLITTNTIDANTQSTLFLTATNTPNGARTVSSQLFS